MTRSALSRRITRALALYCGLLSAALVVWMFSLYEMSRYTPDFIVFWTAGGIGPVADVLYDAARMTAAQAALVDPALGLRPWVYPPPVLWVFQPFAALPFWGAFTVWGVIGAAAFLAAMRGAGVWAVLLAAVSYPVWFALASGQTSLLMGALALTGLLVLDRRPALAGVLWAVAACLKPSLMVLAPVALIAGGHWRGLAWAVGTGMAILATSLIAQGGAMWTGWLTAMQGFPAIVEGLGITGRGVSIGALIHWLDVPATPALALRILAAIVATACCWRLFARPAPWAARLTALIGGALMITPYAMAYDVAVLIPAAAALMLADKTGPRDWWLAVAAAALFFPVPPAGPFVVMLFTLSVCLIPPVRAS